MKQTIKNIEEISKRKTCSSACLKSKNGNIILEKEKTLDRQAEYISELFEDHRKDCSVMKGNFAGPTIKKDEIQVVIRKMKLGKATGPDSISVELLEAFEHYRIDRITQFLNQFYDTGISKFISIALQKKKNNPGATDCELPRMISIMSHITKILLRIILKQSETISNEK